LTREKLQEVLKIIRADVADDKVRIDTPTQNLESYFLGVVQRARESELETSGVTSGSQVAAYRRGDAAGAASPSERVLDRLTRPAPAPTPKILVPLPQERTDHAKLAALTLPIPAETSAPAPAVEAPKSVDLTQADEKLAALLGKPK
jgi:hypothetical protein